MKIYLVLIEDVEKLFMFESKISRLLCELSLESVNRIQRELDNLIISKQKFNDLKKMIDQEANFVPDETLKYIS